jgi:beta-lactamase regulating signal transducer with metallopeptidase domain/HEAT repeat protein
MTLLSYFDSLVGTIAASPLLMLLVKATILLLAALGATLVMRRASAGARHLVWLVALGALMLLPALAAWGPVRIPILAALPVASGTTVGRTPANDPTAGGPPPKTESTPNAAEDRHQSDAALTESTRPLVADPSSNADAGTISTFLTTMSPARAALAFWAAAALACLGWLAYGTLSVHRIVRRARPLNTPDWQTPLYEIADRFALEDAPRILRSEDVKMPFACGVMRPTIVLPAESDTWSVDRRYAVLLHELGHVRRRDLLGHTLGRLVCALYWFHPLVWTAARRLRAESERACDDLALVCGARASDYAEHLLDIVAGVRNHYTPSIALAMAHRKEFEGRMLAILDPELRRSAPSRTQATALTAGLALLSLVVGAATPVARRAEAAPATTLSASISASTSPSALDDAAKRTPVVVVDQNTRKNQRTQKSQSTQQTVAQRESQLSQGAESEQPSQGAQPNPQPLVDAVANVARDAIRTGASEVARELADISPSSAAAIMAIAKAPVVKGQKQDDRPALLANVLKTDSSAELRRVAAWGLAQFAETQIAQDALIEALRKDLNATVREMAAWALGEGDDDAKVVAALGAALKADSDPKVRSTAVWALGQVGDESAIDALTAGLTSDDDKVRSMAAWAIGQIEPDRAPKQLIALLTDKESRVRTMAAWALFQIEDVDAIGALDAALAKETDADVKRAEIRALAAMGDKSVDAIRKLLDTKDQEVRSMAIRALAGHSGLGPWPMPMPRPRPYP